MRAGMPCRGDQARYRAGSREVAGTQCPVRQDLGEYYGQKGPSARRQGLGWGIRQIREVLVALIRNRRLRHRTRIPIRTGTRVMWWRTLTDSMESCELAAEIAILSRHKALIPPQNVLYM